VKFDGRRLRAEYFADEGPETREVATCLPGEDLSQSFLLGLIRFIVRVEGNPPFALHHVARRNDGQHGIESIQSNIAEATLVNVPG
jgi:hypothetical protein